MNSLTKEQLIKALTVYYAEQQETPEEFWQEYDEDPKQDAIRAVEYIFEIVAQQS
jgi:hypothetical protein